MSFKIKKWAVLRTVNLSDYIDHGGLPLTKQAWNFAWQGKVICLVYDADEHPIWAVYDPASDSVDGPYPALAGQTDWGWYNPSHGLSMGYQYWGNQWLMGIGKEEGFYFATGAFFGWDANCNLVDGRPTMTGGRTGQMYSVAGPGTDGANPTFMAWQFKSFDPTVPQAIVKGTLGGGTTVLYEGFDVWLPSSDGTVVGMKELGGYYAYGDLYDHILTDDNHDDPVALGSFGTNWTPLSVMDRGFIPAPGGGVFAYCNPTGGDPYWAEATAPLSPAERTWQSNWDYRLQSDGGYTLDEYDLDGVDHGIYGSPIADHPCFFNADLGWYVGIVSNTQPTSFPVYVLDPYQPTGKARQRAAQTSALGWVGDYALGSDLVLAHVLPFPDDRAPMGGGVHPPQERNDGYLVGRKELFKGASGFYRYQRDISLDLSSYAHDDDWWFPGEEGTRYPGFWQMFAGVGPTVIGYMPDNDWGALDPAANACMRLLGTTQENLNARAPVASHVVRNSLLLTGAPFAVPVGGLYSHRVQLISGLDGQTFVYTDNGTQIGGPPAWKAVAGRVSGTTWTTVIDFADLERPGLGETGWTVWSVVPIPACRALPMGGWLVGATLYFDPWEVGGWELSPGGRDATFRDTGQGWLPAIPGWIGPLQTDYHEPRYVVTEDEWSVARATYGPDALLVYHDQGSFVECLNSPDLHAPDGREIMVAGAPYSNPTLVFRVYRHGTYSDFAEGFGLYHRLGADVEVQAPLYACYDLLDGAGAISPGAGAFKGFFDMYAVGDYAPQDADWRWDTVCGGIYDSVWPKLQWSPAGGSYVRSGKGGGGVTLLTPGPGSGRSGIKGVGVRG